MRSKITLIAMVAAALAFPTAGALAQRGGGHGGGGHGGGGGGAHASFGGGGHFGGGARFGGRSFGGGPGFSSRMGTGARFAAFNGGHRGFVNGGRRGFVGFRDRGFSRFSGRTHFARFNGDRRFVGHGFRRDRFFRHHRFARFHHRRFFFGAPFFAADFGYDYAYNDACWVWRPTAVGWRRVWVCSPYYDYSYYGAPFYEPYASLALY